jgi:hypothetical protein
MTATKNPVALAGADRARNTDLAGWQIGPEHTPTAPDLQLFRAAWLMRRVPLSPQTARAVLSLYFGESAR